MIYLNKVAADVVGALLDNDAASAVKYLDPKSVVRATRRLRDRKLPSRHANTEILLTIGRPNYLERDFIKACKKAGEKFPVRKVQLKYPPKQKDK